MRREVLARGSLGGDVRELGVRRIHRHRNEIDFFKLLESAKRGTELRLLGVCLAGFAGLLIVDPNSSVVRAQGVDERRKYEDSKTDIEAADERARDQGGRHPYDLQPAFRIALGGSPGKRRSECRRASRCRLARCEAHAGAPVPSMTVAPTMIWGGGKLHEGMVPVAEGRPPQKDREISRGVSP